MEELKGTSTQRMKNSDIRTRDRVVDGRVEEVKAIQEMELRIFFAPDVCSLTLVQLLPWVGRLGGHPLLLEQPTTTVPHN